MNKKKISEFGLRIKDFLRSFFVGDLLYSLSKIKTSCSQRSAEYIEWLNRNAIKCADGFFASTEKQNMIFLGELEKIFNSKRFEMLLRRWLVEYVVRLFDIMHDLFLAADNNTLIFELEDNLLNRFMTDYFTKAWDVGIKVKWIKRPSYSGCLMQVIGQVFLVLFLSLKNGIILFEKKRNFIVMRESIWGLYGVFGDYFHDDFLVDDEKIKTKDLLLFSRGVPSESGRLKAYFDAKKSDYCHFNLFKISLSSSVFFKRIIPKYLLHSISLLFKKCSDIDFTLYKSLLVYFVTYALPYEKIFSHYNVKSEMGHNYFSPSHIPESIICENHGTKYYLMHWSDKSIDINNFIGSFLSCDGFVIWGKSHIRGVEGENVKFLPFGYVFKKFIKEVTEHKSQTILKMGIRPKGKIISFFDESFGGWCKMTAQHYLNFWKAAINLAEKEPNSTVIMHQKEVNYSNKLPPELSKDFSDIREHSRSLENFFEVDSLRWSFIETIGVSDIVVTQGMTSSATIAIISGKTGLFFDQADYRHPFSKNFKDILVFSDEQRLISAIGSILVGKTFPLSCISEEVLRSYDQFSDDRSIELFRDLLVTGKTG